MKETYDHLFYDARSEAALYDAASCEIIGPKPMREFGSVSLDRVSRQALQRRSASGLARGHWLIQA